MNCSPCFNMNFFKMILKKKKGGLCFTNFEVGEKERIYIFNSKMNFYRLRLLSSLKMALKMCDYHSQCFIID